MQDQNRPVVCQKILGVSVHSISNSDFFNYCNSVFHDDAPNIYSVYSINPEIVMFAQRNDVFRYVLNHSFIGLPDGIGIIWASTYIRKPLKQRITGVFAVENLIQLAIKEKLIVGIVGGKKQASSILFHLKLQSHPDSLIWSDQGPDISLKSENTGNPSTPLNPSLIFSDSTIQNINHWLIHPPSLSTISNKLSVTQHLRKTSLLIVGFGAPKQEFFIASLLQLAGKPHQPLMAVAAGGSIDELSGVSPKPPKIVEDLGLKWLFRLITDPIRLKRQKVLPSFITLILKSKYNFY